MYQPVQRSNGAGAARVQRQAQILTRLYDERFPEPYAIRCNEGEWAGWLTSGQLARSCGMASSPHFRAMLYELHQDGFLLFQTTPYRKNVHAHMWQIADNARWSLAWIRVFDAYLGQNMAEKMGISQEGK